MPNTGLKHFVYAPYAESGTTVTYGTGRIMAKALNANLTIETNKVDFYADDGLSETDASFKSGTISMGIDDLLHIAVKEVLGATINAQSELISNSGDIAPYVGVGFYAKRKKDKTVSWRAFWIKKVQFKNPATELETKGESPAFKNSTIEGTIMEDVNGNWKEEKIFNTEAEALAWVDGKANLSTRVAIPVASVVGGTYTGTQSVTLTCATSGATIKYTTNGTTPSATNGTAYSTAISVSASTVLRAIATKSAMDNSDIMYHEYTITV